MKENDLRNVERLICANSDYSYAQMREAVLANILFHQNHAQKLRNLLGDIDSNNYKTDRIRDRFEGLTCGFTR